MLKSSSSIGTKKESSLHHSLKFQYSLSGETEIAIGEYICDGQGGQGEIIEVQTGSFGPLKEKAKQLAQTGKLKIIHPIINQKQIELYDTNGQLISRRKSPRKGKVWDLFSKLIYAPEIPLLKNLSIELAVVDIVEKRIDDGCGSWRRKGVSISNRILEAYHHSVVLKNRKDYYQFIPFKSNEHFTTGDLALKAGIKSSLARKTLYVLAKMSLVERIGKQGKAIVYRQKPLTTRAD